MTSRAVANRGRWSTRVRWALVGLAAADLVALKAGWSAHPHWVLAALMTAAMLAQLMRVIELAFVLLRGQGSELRVYARLAVALGVALALGGGLANWALGLQGYVILTEGERAQLRGGAELQAFDPGPFGDIEELEIVLGLEELELLPRGPDFFIPSSRLSVWRGHAEPAPLRIDPRESGKDGALRFYQGAFGFAPRIVILRDGETTESVFDKVVPFLTERHGPQGILFHGSFTIEERGLRVEGVIGLDTLDEGMRGHATLDLTVTLDGRQLGSGRLLPGHFAELDDGYRVGFAGLKRWSEIVISRRNYGTVLLAGTGLAAVGGFLLLVGRTRRR